MNPAPDPQLSAADDLGSGELRLPPPPGAIRRFWAHHPRITDGVLALLIGGLAATASVRLGTRAPDALWLGWLTLALIVVAVSGIFVRRTRPLLAAALAGAAVVASVWAPGLLVLTPVVFAVYSVPVHRSVRAGWITAAATAGAGTIAIALAILAGGSDPADAAGAFPGFEILSDAAVLAVVLGLALAIGINVGNRRRYLGALVDRARQLAVERDQQAQIATAAERARIAREMHDIVSHSLTVMITLAEGSAVAADIAAPDAAHAMRKAADTGRSAMVDMRRMLGVLGGQEGEGTAATAPQPGFAELPALIEQFRSLGIPVTFRREGAESGDPTVQLAVHRIVQEALTNTLRYAHGPTEVTVHVTSTLQDVRVLVVDNGLAGFPTESAGTGRGLLGLRERIAALGGTFASGPRADGHGWRVAAVIPLTDEKKDATP